MCKNCKIRDICKIYELISAHKDNIQINVSTCNYSSANRITDQISNNFNQRDITQIQNVSQKIRELELKDANNTNVNDQEEEEIEIKI